MAAAISSKKAIHLLLDGSSLGEMLARVSGLRRRLFINRRKGISKAIRDGLVSNAPAMNVDPCPQVNVLDGSRET
jgi:hypothetical protein